MVNPSSRWRADDYTTSGAFVPALAGQIVATLDARPGERILDVGCGDGLLTDQIRAGGAEVVGIDASPDLVGRARARGLNVVLGDAGDMTFDAEFDAVFSNAALHWMLEPARVADRMYAALRPGGRLAVEFGGFGNIAAIRTALNAALEGRTSNDQYYPDAAQYARVLSDAGFEDVETVLVPRPTRLEHGIVAWLHTFRGGLMDRLELFGAEREKVFTEVAALLEPALLDSKGTWWADYVRIRATARKY